MTTRATVRKAEIQRRIRALVDEGLPIRGIAPDGTILVDSTGLDSTGLETEQGATLAPEVSKWLEVKA